MGEVRYDLTGIGIARHRDDGRHGIKLSNKGCGRNT